MNPHNTVFDAKRLIGRKFSDAEVQSDIKHFPFTVFDKASKPYIRVQYRGEDKEFVSTIFFTLMWGMWLMVLVVPRGDLFHGAHQDEGGC